MCKEGETIASPKTVSRSDEGKRMTGRSGSCGIDAVLFDFGGVLADEGYKKGLHAIARRHGMNENDFFSLARELIYATGYITGRSTEAVYWQAIRDRTGIADSDADLRQEILSRFVLRPFMFDIAARLRAAGIKAAILSDQTNWLDELDVRLDIFGSFDAVYNSYHLGKSKADVSHFADVVSRMKDTPGRILFVDDDEAHCQRARSAGLKAIQYAGRDAFEKEFALYCRL